MDAKPVNDAPVARSSGLPSQVMPSQSEGERGSTQAEGTELERVPPRVRDHVRRQLGVLALLTRARQTDAKFGGGGRYEAEAYLERKDALERAWQLLREFEELCGQNGVQPATIYQALGQPAQLSDAARAWLNRTSAGKPDERVSDGNRSEE